MTDKILIDRSVLEQALDAFDVCKTESTGYTPHRRLRNAAITALRAALDKPACKLVGWWHDVEDSDECDFFYVDAINGDCPSCHPCYADIGGEA